MLSSQTKSLILHLRSQAHLSQTQEPRDLRKVDCWVEIWNSLGNLPLIVTRPTHKSSQNNVRASYMVTWIIPSGTNPSMEETLSEAQDIRINIHPHYTIFGKANLEA